MKNKNSITRLILLSLSLFIIIGNSFSQEISSKASGFLNDGLKLKAEKKCEAAIELYKKALAINPVYREALYETGWCYNEMGKYPEAVTFLTKAKKEWPDAPKVNLELGYANYQLKNDDDAIMHYSKCLELDDEYSLAYKYLGDLYYSRQEYAKALDNFKLYIIHAEKITSPLFYYKKGYCENEQGKFDDAIISLKKSLELKNDEPKCFDELGYAYYKINDAENAIIQYNKSIALKPKSHVPYLGIGDVQRILKKNTDEGLINYLKAAEINPESKKAYYSAGWCYNNKQQYLTALGYLKKAIALDKDYKAALTEIGYSYYSLGEYQNAISNFEKSISLDAKNILPHYYAGLCYLAMKNKAEVLKKISILEELKSPYAEKLKTKLDTL